MNTLQLVQQGVLNYGMTHFNSQDRASPQAVQIRVDQDLSDSNITWHTFRSSCLILDFRGEGHCDKDIVHIVSWLRQHNINNFVVVFNSIVETDALDYAAFSAPTHLANSYDWFSRYQPDLTTVTTNCKFLCLIRSVSDTRAQFAAKLLEKNLDLRLSFGAMHQPQELSAWQHWFPKHQLPIMLDGCLVRTPKYCRDHDISSKLFDTCVVNIVVESSDQDEDNRWSSMFITEKSFKAFALRQIPIWWTVPGLVSQVRNLGFDVFDDIVDHSYDAIDNKQQRMAGVLSEVERLNELDLTAVRQQHHARLLANWKLLDQIVNSVGSNFRQQLERYINV